MKTITKILIEGFPIISLEKTIFFFLLVFTSHFENDLKIYLTIKYCIKQYLFQTQLKLIRKKF